MAFNRLVSVTAGEPGKEGITVQDLYISFDIDKTFQTTLNKCSIRIFNISRDSAAIMGKTNNVVNLKIGYADENKGALKSIFIGQVVKGVYGKEGENTVLTIEALDNFSSTGATGTWGGDRIVKLSYAANTPASTIYNYILTQLAVTISGETPEINKIYAHGFSFNGRLTAALGKILEYHNYRYSVQNGTFVIFQGKTAPKTATVLFLTLESGLIKVSSLDQVMAPGDPRNIWKGKKYKIQSLIFPELNPLSLFKLGVPKNEGDGFFDGGIDGRGLITTVQIETVKMVGDNFGGDWHAECDVHTIGV